MVSHVIKVCPKAEELCVVRVNIPCPVDGCASVLPHVGSLRIHLLKTHRINNESPSNESSNVSSNNHESVIKQFHCPVENCVYNVSSKRHFASNKLLKQHYMKVHADKKYKCIKCGSGFGLERDCRRHQLTCGVIFRCQTCECPFSSVEATVNHCRNKNHQLPEECRNIKSNKAPSSAPPQTIVILQTLAPSNVSSASSKIPNSGPSNSKGPPSLRPLLPKPVIKTAVLPPLKPIQAPQLTAAPLGHHTLLTTTQYEKPPSGNTGLQTEDKAKEKRALAMPSPISTSLSAELLLDGTGRQGPKYSKSLAQTDWSFLAGSARKRLSKTPGDNTSDPKFTSSTGIQTSVSLPPVKDRSHHAMVGTQTIGDLILTSAMTLAQIPIQRASQGSQANPEGQRQCRRNYTRESSQTQTIEILQPPRGKKRRKVSATTQQESEATENLFFLKQTDNHTQTSLSNCAPAISTQTNMTCLMNSWTPQKSRPNPCSSFGSNQPIAKDHFYEMAPSSYGRLEALPFPNETNSSNRETSSSSEEMVSTGKSLLPAKSSTFGNNVETGSPISLIYSSINSELVQGPLPSEEPQDVYTAFSDGISEDPDNSDCTNLLTTLSGHHQGGRDYENLSIRSSVYGPKKASNCNQGKPKALVNEPNSEDLPLQGFIDQDHNDPTLSRTVPEIFSTPQRNTLNDLRSLEESLVKKTLGEGTTNAGLLTSFVSKDPIFCDDPIFSDVEDSSDGLSYVKMDSLTNDRDFAASSTSALEIANPALIPFKKKMAVTDNPSINSDNYLLRPTKAKTVCSKPISHYATSLETQNDNPSINSDNYLPRPTKAKTVCSKPISHYATSSETQNDNPSINSDNYLLRSTKTKSVCSEAIGGYVDSLKNQNDNASVNSDNYLLPPTKAKTVCSEAIGQYINSSETQNDNPSVNSDDYLLRPTKAKTVCSEAIGQYINSSEAQNDNPSVNSDDYLLRPTKAKTVCSEAIGQYINSSETQNDNPSVNSDSYLLPPLKAKSVCSEKIGRDLTMVPAKSFFSSALQSDVPKSGDDPQSSKGYVNSSENDNDNPSVNSDNYLLRPTKAKTVCSKAIGHYATSLETQNDNPSINSDNYLLRSTKTKSVCSEAIGEYVDSLKSQNDNASVNSDDYLLRPTKAKTICSKAIGHYATSLETQNDNSSINSDNYLLPHLKAKTVCSEAIGQYIDSSETQNDNPSVNSDSYLLPPLKTKSVCSEEIGRDLTMVPAKSFFSSALQSDVPKSGDAPQSSKGYINSSENDNDNPSVNSDNYLLRPTKAKTVCSEAIGQYVDSTAAGFESDHLRLKNPRACPTMPCVNRLFAPNKDVTSATSCHLRLPAPEDIYGVPSDVLGGGPERRTISTCMDDLMNADPLTLPGSTEEDDALPFTPLVADIEVQTLDLDNDFEALLNGAAEHSRSSSSAIDMYTQTVEDMLDLFGNTTETQTSVDDTFFPGLEFSDIETQTTSGELDCLDNPSLTTAGTQTTLSNQNLNKGVEFSDMETQTGFSVCDLDTFLTDSHTQTTFDELEDFLSNLK